ncbi:MAG TPA: hypothetical protein VHL53_00710, partial [Acidimicrobiia bacterium]|nr:hypothetical protein [Acidimicrobiia bacterium]
MPAVPDWRVTTLVRAEWQRLLAGGLLVVAAGSLTVGVRQLARSSSGAEEVTYLISGGLVGLGAVIVAVAVFLSADVDDVLRKLHRIEQLRAGAAVPTPLEAISRCGAGAAPAQASAGDALRPRRWSRAWRVGSVAVLGIGGLLVLTGWKGAAGTADLGRALDGLVLAVLGILVGVAALGALGLRSYAELRRYQRQVLQPVIASDDGPAEGPIEVSMAASPATGDRWTAPGLTRLHRRGCPALASAATPARPAPSPSPLEACLLCHPEEG